MLESEVTVDRNNFINLIKFCLKFKCKFNQCSGADLQYNAAAALDVRKTDGIIFCNNLLHLIVSDCTVSANGLKISNANGKYTRKNFQITKMQKTRSCRVFSKKKILVLFSNRIE